VHLDSGVNIFIVNVSRPTDAAAPFAHEKEADS